MTSLENSCVGTRIPDGTTTRNTSRSLLLISGTTWAVVNSDPSGRTSTTSPELAFKNDDVIVVWNLGSQSRQPLSSMRESRGRLPIQLIINVCRRPTVFPQLFSWQRQPERFLIQAAWPVSHVVHSLGIMTQTHEALADRRGGSRRSTDLLPCTNDAGLLSHCSLETRSRSPGASVPFAFSFLFRRRALLSAAFASFPFPAVALRRCFCPVP